MRVSLAAALVLASVFVAASSLRGANDGAPASPSDMRAQLRDEAYKQAEETINRNLIEQLISKGQEASKLLGDFHAKAGQLLPRLDKLLGDDDGKKIAIDDVAFLNFMRLQDHPPTTLKDIEAKQKSIDSIVSKLKKQLAAAAVAYVPPMTMNDEVDSTREWAIEGVAQMNETTGWLDTIIARAPKDADLAKVQTLKQRIDSYNAGKIDLLLKSRLVGEAAAQPEAQKTVQDAARLARLIEAQADADRLVGETKAQMDRMRIEYEMQLKQMQEEQQKRLDTLNKELADAKAARTIQDAKNQATVQKSEQDADFLKKRQAAHDPDVAKVLAPFLAKGYWQPRSGKGIDSEPMSLSQIRATGALSPNKRGIELLMKCANYRTNDRTHWGAFLQIDQGTLSPTNDQIEMVKKAQGYLNDLGDALVAEGMLAK